MKTSTLFSLFISALLPLVFAVDSTNVTEEIINNAAADNIDLTRLDFLNDALAEITAAYEIAPGDQARRGNLSRFVKRDIAVRDAEGPNLTEFLSSAQRVDVHSHVTPSWYRGLVPLTGGNPTPVWDLQGHIAFMDSLDIDKAIISISAPAANVFQGNKLLTVALARLINEQVAAYSAAFPDRLKFYAVVPLPYIQEAVVEARYALEHLGAVGIFLTSNFEGAYLGNPKFKPFFQAVEAMEGKKVFDIHPSTPYLASSNHLVEANPTTYPSGNIEFYFETARTLMDLTLTQTIHNYSSINYLIPHAGGAFPATIDRFLKSFPPLYDSSMQIYKTRFWWDSAGPTYYHQISGLLGYGIPKSQLVFGTDFPYAPSFTQAGSLNAILSSTLFTLVEITDIFSNNVRNLFAGVNA